MVRLTTIVSVDMGDSSLVYLFLVVWREYRDGANNLLSVVSFVDGERIYYRYRMIAHFLFNNISAPFPF